MSFSLDTPSAQTLKSEAKSLREQRAKSGENLTHGAALEEVARAHGYRDWNTARAMLPERIAVPFQLGMRVKGLYLGQPYRGVLIAVSVMADMQHYKITAKFDEPVNVSPGFTFANFRHRVNATITVRGVTPATNSNGPQMTVERE